MTKSISKDQLNGEYRSVGLFIENAKTYIQLSTGALLLSVTFSQGLSGQTHLPLFDANLWISWLAWLLAILVGAMYQYCAAKYLERLEQKHGSLFYGHKEPIKIIRYWTFKPYILYGTMLFSFYVGTIWFAGAAAYRLIINI